MTPRLANQRRRMVASRGADKREKLWRAMRILRTFTIGELAAVTELASVKSVSAFCSELRRAGYLTVQRGNHHRGECARYRLIRNSGPLSPWATNHSAAVYDPNTNTEYPIRQGQPS